eukprot:729392-Hanusia_phi.AAC.1
MVYVARLALVAAAFCVDYAVGFVNGPAGFGLKSGRLPAVSQQQRVSRNVLMSATLDPSEKTKSDTKLNIEEAWKSFLKVSPLTRKINAQSSDGRKTVVITGASSGIGLQTAKAMSAEKGWHVIMAVRSYSKAARAAEEIGMEPGTYTIMNLDLASLSSVRDFVNQLRLLARPIDAIVCNAAVWYPRDTAPRLTVDGFEEAVGTNHLGHFLLCNLLLGDLPEGEGRVVFIGTETANDGLAGLIPPVADLGKLEGMAAGMKNTIDGGKFEPTKAYKDSKVCNAIVMREMNKRYGKSRGLVVNAMFPGCIAESPLFRQKRGWFRWLFPKFQKFVTKQFVPEEIAGQRVANVVADEELGVGGTYWKWNAQSGKDFTRVAFDEQKEAAANLVKIPAEALDEMVSEAVWDLSSALVGLGVAPEISFAENKESLTLQGKYVPASLAKASVMLKKLNEDMSSLKDQKQVMAMMEEAEGKTAEAVGTLYYWGRRVSAPKISFSGNYETPQDKLQMQISVDKPRADPLAADVLLKGLTSTLKNYGANTKPAPGMTFIDEREGQTEGVAEDNMKIKLEPSWTANDDSMAMTKEFLGKELLGNDTREDLKVVSREQVMKWTAEMDKIKSPPAGLDAQVFGERDSVKRLVFEAVSRGAVRN